MTPIYPTRSLIKFIAKSQLAADLAGREVLTFIHRQGETQPSQAVQPQTRHDLHSTAYAETAQTSEQLDEELFQAIVTSRFHPSQNPDLYDPCASRNRAAAIEARVAAEIVQHYKQFKQRQRGALVDRLNRLL